MINILCQPFNELKTNESTNFFKVVAANCCAKNNSILSFLYNVAVTMRHCK